MNWKKIAVYAAVAVGATVVGAKYSTAVNKAVDSVLGLGKKAVDACKGSAKEAASEAAQAGA